MTNVAAPVGFEWRSGRGVVPFYVFDDDWQPAAGNWMSKPITDITVTIPIRDAQKFAKYPGVYSNPIYRLVDAAVKEAEGTFGANIEPWDPGKAQRVTPNNLDTTTQGV